MTDPKTTAVLGGPNEVMIFFRAGQFYPVQGFIGKPLTEQAADHAMLNPGTKRIEDIRGNVLWRIQ